MKRLLMLFVLLMIPIVSALSFPEDTTFSNGDIDFTFKQGVKIDDFNLITSGIIVDDYRIVITQEGGTLDIIFEEWNDVKIISVESSVPQKLAFKITSEGQKYYVYDGTEYTVDKYDIGVERVYWTFSQFEEHRMIDDVVILGTQSSWWDTIVFFFEVPELSTGSTTLGGKMVIVTYKTTVVFSFIMIIIILFIAWRGRK